MSRPTVQTAKPADAYASPNERIVEFFDKDAQQGGLISIIRRDDGNLNVGVSNLDDGVSVSCPAVSDLLAACKYALTQIMAKTPDWSGAQDALDTAIAKAGG